MDARDVKAAVRDRLTRAGCLAADEEAEELLATFPDAGALDRGVARREAGEPLAWITGRVNFCGTSVSVHRGLFVPRHQSEELACRAARALPPAGGLMADVCTGAGAIAVAVAGLAPTASVVATDVDEHAARCCRCNGVPVVVCDVGDGLAPRTFDVVTAVAPYVPTDALGFLPADVQRYEPRAALDGGSDGLDVVRRVVATASRVLVPGGSLFVEIGAGQPSALEAVLVAHRFEAPELWYDEEGDVRGLGARLSP